jgi:hypothetical protein
VVSVGNEDPAPEALRSHASVQHKMRIQENAKNQERELKQTEKSINSYKHMLRIESKTILSLPYIKHG